MFAYELAIDRDGIPDHPPTRLVARSLLDAILDFAHARSLLPRTGGSAIVYAREPGADGWQPYLIEAEAAEVPGETE